MSQTKLTLGNKPRKMPKMKNATPRRNDPFGFNFQRAYATACGAINTIGTCAAGYGGFAPIAAGYGYGIGWIVAGAAIGFIHALDDDTAPTGWRPENETDRPDPEAWSWASPQGLPTAGPGQPLRGHDGRDERTPFPYYP